MVKLMLDGFGGDQRKSNAFPPAAFHSLEQDNSRRALLLIPSR
jgi:hypothetical protein